MKYFFVAIVMWAACVSAAGAPRAAVLTGETALSAAAPCAGRAWCVTVEVTGASASKSRVQKTNSPLAGFVGRSDMFEVRRADGTLVAYQGIHAKRLENAEEEFVELAAGETLSGVVDLASAYEFVAGEEYQVRLLPTAFGASAPVAVVAEEEEAKQAAATSLIATESSGAPFRYSWRTGASSGREASEQRVRLLGYTTDGCSSSQESGFALESSNALTAAVNARDYMDNSTVNSGDLYVEWFGTPTSGRQAKLLLTFSNMVTRHNAGYVLKCDGDRCDSNTVAYVFKADSSYRVHVCDAYFTLSQSISINSRPGTIVHELSHFETVGDTSDHTYFPDNCRDLAQTNPVLAVDNADSLEYFAESLSDQSGALSAAAPSLPLCVAMLAALLALFGL